LKREGLNGLHIFDRRHRTLGRHGFDGFRLQTTREATGRSLMSNDFFYVVGSVVSGLLLVYLIYALFRAEEF
jgi:K+-transporting ATPase KdpF subunit